jgi:hypothetical protein
MYSLASLWLPVLQKLPDWGSVRPRTSTRWDHRADTPGGTAAATPAASRAATPRPPATAPAAAALPAPLQVQPQGGAGLAAGGAAAGGPQAAQPEEAAYSLVCTGSHVEAARRDASSRPKTQQAGQQRARTTPFAPRPNSREAPPYGHEGSSGRLSSGIRPGSGSRQLRQQSAQPGGGGRRPRGTPLYDAATLLPLHLNDLHSVASRHSSDNSGGAARQAANRQWELHAGGSWEGGWAGGHAAGTGAAAFLEGLSAEAAATAGADGGPLDALLSQVDRLLSQVGRAIS